MPEWLESWSTLIGAVVVTISLAWSAGKVGKRMGELRQKLEDHIQVTDKVLEKMHSEVKLLRQSLSKFDARIDAHGTAIARLQGFVDAVNHLNNNHDKENPKI